MMGAPAEHMRVLYVAMKYDYGVPERGLSFEHHNFYECLQHMGLEVDYFDFKTIMRESGKERMNELLVERVEETSPNVMFTCLYEDEIEQDTLRRVTEGTETTTVNWFCDDHWRFDDFSRHYAPCFDWVTTTDRSAVPKYDAIGHRNVIKTQWAVNPFTYRKMGIPLAYDMTFVGRPHGDRRSVVQQIRRSGIDVQAWGLGWENGRISQEDMIRVFNQSRINLNLSNSSVVQPRYQVDLGRTGKVVTAALSKLPGGWTVRKLVRDTILPAVVPVRSAGPGREKGLEQIKGRNFEVPGCGGFILTSEVEDLQSYYVPGKEIACYSSIEDLVDQARYYLDNEGERQEIARRGYDRTLREHTYIHRFAEIFERIGHPLDRPLADLLPRLDERSVAIT